MYNEITVDEVNDLYVTKVSSGVKLYFKLYKDTELIHTHIKHIDDEELMTVHTMVLDYVKELEREVSEKTESIMKDLRKEFTMDNDDLIARPLEAYRVRNRERMNSLIKHTPKGMGWSWSESTDPSNLI